MKSNKIMFIFVLVVGVVLGGFLGEISSSIPYLNWLSYGQALGISEPLKINLGIIDFTLGFMIKLNIASIIGLILALLIYKLVDKKI